MSWSCSKVIGELLWITVSPHWKPTFSSVSHSDLLESEASSKHINHICFASVIFTSDSQASSKLFFFSATRINHYLTVNVFFLNIKTSENIPICCHVNHKEIIRSSLSMLFNKYNKIPNLNPFNVIVHGENLNRGDWCGLQISI